ncbi:hypothetical protein K435DRAFT_787355, partial [Dendrothele bispora CBS 962.96]
MFGQRLQEDPLLWPTHFPVLENLAVHVINHQDDYMGSHPCTTLSAPLLQSFTHTGHGIEILSPESTDSTSSFKYLRSLSFSDHLCESTLSMASSITSVTLRKIRGFSYSGYGVVPCLAREVSLVLDTMGPWSSWEIKSVLEYMALPNVTSFHLGTSLPSGSGGQMAETSNMISFHEELISLFNRSSAASITDFTITDIWVKDEALLAVLSQLPSLSRLAVGDVTSHCQDEHVESTGTSNMLSCFFLRSLSCPIHVDSSSPVHVPKLIELHIAFGYTLNARRCHAFLDMIESRVYRYTENETIARLRYVRVKLMVQNMDADTLERLNRLRGEELMIDIDFVNTRKEWKS